ncbi:hypothetical protein D3C81_1060730 [compost metagenome]
MGKAFGVQGQGHLPAFDHHIDQALTVLGPDLQGLNTEGRVAQALIGFSGAHCTAPIHNQKFAGVLALMISASSWPMFLKLCGRVVGM